MLMRIDSLEMTPVRSTSGWGQTLFEWKTLGASLEFFDTVKHSWHMGPIQTPPCCEWLGGRDAHDWRSPILARKALHKVRAFDPLGPFYIDIEVGDMRDVVDYLFSFGRKEINSEYASQR